MQHFLNAKTLDRLLTKSTISQCKICYQFVFRLCGYCVLTWEGIEHFVLLKVFSPLHVTNSFQCSYCDKPRRSLHCVTTLLEMFFNLQNKTLESI